MFDVNDLIWLDFETTSALDLKTVGSSRYASDVSTRAIVLAYAIGNSSPFTWHNNGEILDWDHAPSHLRGAFARGAIFAMWNVGFDSAIWNYATLGFPFLAPERVIDPMIQAAVSNLPTDLESASRALGGAGKRKDGKKLIKLFCIEGAAPCEHPEQWQQFLAYARQDIGAMRDDVYRWTRPLPRKEWQQYWACERVNRRGVAIDVPYVRRAAVLAAEDAIASGRRLAELTDGTVTRVGQAKRLATWMHDQLADAEMREVLILGVPRDDDDDGGDHARPRKPPLPPIAKGDLSATDPRGRLVGWILEREAIRQRRELGQPPPWTTDPILAGGRFCNVYSEHDRVTRWVTTNVVERFRGDQDCWFAVVIARCINEPDAIAEILPHVLPFNAARCREILEARKARGAACFRTAYKVPTTPTEGDNNIRFLFEDVLAPMWRQRGTLRPRANDTLATYSARLETCYRIGAFLSAQICADLKHIQPLKSAADWWTFARPGPGSKRGLNRVRGKPVKAPWNETIWHRELTALHGEIAPLLEAAHLAPLDLQNCQNCLCEFDKAERAREGSGRTARPYKPPGEPTKRGSAPRPVVPPPTPKAPAPPPTATETPLDEDEFSLTRDRVARVLDMLEVKRANGGLRMS